MKYIIHNDQFRQAIEELKRENKLKFILKGLELYIIIDETKKIKLDLYSEHKHTYKCEIHGEIETMFLINTYNCINEDENTSPIFLEMDIQNQDNYIYIINEKTGRRRYESTAYLNIKHVNNIQNNDN